MGGTLTNTTLDLMDVNRVVPQIQFGLDSNDPAQAMFAACGTSSNKDFPSATNTDCSNAKGIYALLTGRVTAINGDASRGRRDANTPSGTPTTAATTVDATTRRMCSPSRPSTSPRWAIQKERTALTR
jgi:hypothetical protein